MPKPTDVMLGMQKLERAGNLLRSLDDFATSLLGKTAEALDLNETALGLLNGSLTADDAGNVTEVEDES